MGLWLPVLVWAGLIFALSSVPDLGTGLGGWDLVLRKLAHAGEYAVLGALLQRVLGRPGLAFALGALYALSDEIHQSFVPGRQGSPLDVALDAAGVAVGVALWHLAQTRGFAERVSSMGRHRHAFGTDPGSDPRPFDMAMSDGAAPPDAGSDPHARPTGGDTSAKSAHAQGQTLAARTRPKGSGPGAEASPYAAPTAIAVDLDGALGDTNALWRDWLASVQGVLGVEAAELPCERGSAAAELDRRGAGNWRVLLERFGEDRAPVYLRRDAVASAALQSLADAGCTIGVFTDAPEPLARVALAQLGAERRVTAVETGSGALERLLARLAADAVVVSTRDELVAYASTPAS